MPISFPNIPWVFEIVTNLYFDYRANVTNLMASKFSARHLDAQQSQKQSRRLPETTNLLLVEEMEVRVA
jgi:hypothetical protein